MSPAPVAIRIGGQTYRVRAHASEPELHRLAASVDARLRQISASSYGGSSQQGLLLVAISLAHELDAERCARKKLQQDTTEILQLLLDHVDRSLATADAAIAAMPQAANPSDY
jgi:cell division protein ZapA